MIASAKDPALPPLLSFQELLLVNLPGSLGELCCTLESFFSFDLKLTYGMTRRMHSTRTGQQFMRNKITWALSSRLGSLGELCCRYSWCGHQEGYGSRV
jgi:hypothetical protein